LARDSQSKSTAWSLSVAAGSVAEFIRRLVTGTPLATGVGLLPHLTPLA